MKHRVKKYRVDYIGPNSRPLIERLLTIFLSTNSSSGPQMWELYILRESNY